MEVRLWGLGRKGKYVQLDTSETKIREMVLKGYNPESDRSQRLHGTPEVDFREFSFYGLSKLLKYGTSGNEQHSSGILKILTMAKEYAEKHEVSDVLIQNLNIEKEHVTADISGLAQLLLKG